MSDSLIIIKSSAGAEIYRSPQKTIKRAVVEAIKSRADLSGADLIEADLGGADLIGADLRETDLSGVNLSDADLRGTSLRGTKNIILGPQRSDGYLFYLSKADSWHIIAGCRDFSDFPTARAHWQSTRGGTPLGDETMDILNFLEKRLSRQEVK